MLAFGCRTLAQRRVTGDTGLRLDAGPAGSTAVFVASVQVQVGAVEDPYLIRTHGATYLAYAARTGRFWPGLGHRTTPVNGPVMR
ncbi:hypothetical protein RM555_17310 [Micromonospora sp. DSM 115977]|uniref:Uncharacterized protein n=1 Tax=Micromonospora reichwaldensis TaxID=3075516 RepID=A0ABU2WYQ5_9ACTN|nr:hypothetical protein [Micromonospora sp. DSM 115977]MDT0530754.1 hypothetical protein [Micromonospora sp. DSM 115977]